MPTTTDDASTRERLLDAADVLMHARGYEAVGVAELCREAGAKKGSFYFFFDSKQALALEMLDRSWRRTRTTLFERSVGDESLSGLEAIDRYGELLADNLERLRGDHDVVAGCRFGNFAAEMSTRDETIRETIAVIFDEMTALIEAALRRSVDVGELDPATDIAEAAATVIAHMEGLMVMAKARRNPSLLRRLGPDTRRLLS